MAMTIASGQDWEVSTPESWDIFHPSSLFCLFFFQICKSKRLLEIVYFQNEMCWNVTGLSADTVFRVICWAWKLKNKTIRGSLLTCRLPLTQRLAVMPALLIERPVDVILLCGLHFTPLSTAHCSGEKRQNGRKTGSQIRERKMKERGQKKERKGQWWRGEEEIMWELVCEGHRGWQSAMQKAPNRQPCRGKSATSSEIMDYDGHHS